MKVSYPLSLKISGWLLLNLLLLAAAALAFFVVQGGLGWNALLAGPAGERAQATANVVAGEATAATKPARDAVLARLGAAYGAQFRLFRVDEFSAASVADLPAPVREKLEFRPPRLGGPGDFGPFGERRGGGPGERGGKRDWSGHERRDPGMEGRENPEPVRVEPKRLNNEGDHGRFIVRTSSPAAYWIGLRVPLVSAERGRLVPTLLLIRVDSFWGLLRLLDLQSWLLAGTGVLALSVLFWAPLVRGITKALSQLTNATERIADGRFDTRVPVHSRDEIGQLGESVNRMAARLDAHMTGQKRFLGDVAHELCSPLARLQMATGILGERAPEGLRDTVEDVREEVQQMSTLVNELLVFAKAGMQPRAIALNGVEIGALAQQVLTREDPTRRVTTTVPPGLLARADAELLARALANLVRNALRYGETGPIALTATRESDRVIIRVEDEGPGVPPEALDRLGEPFFRPELARTRELGGVGLGLSIVRHSISACGGEVRFTNRAPRGFRAEIRLAAA
ncbi:MAG: hypothetical protein RIQ93_919 [Verrucomicrobiota bacterium]|jgi:two-component system sensor histidine kinase CpxA